MHIASTIYIFNEPGQEQNQVKCVMGSAKNLIPKIIYHEKTNPQAEGRKKPTWVLRRPFASGFEERERSGYVKREIRIWTERPGDGEREREREREIQRWKERPSDGEREIQLWREREVSWSAMGGCSLGGFGGRGWAEDFGRERFWKFWRKKVGKVEGSSGRVF
jgi:hypothetical protein